MRDSGPLFNTDIRGRAVHQARGVGPRANQVAADAAVSLNRRHRTVGGRSRRRALDLTSPPGCSSSWCCTASSTVLTCSGLGLKAGDTIMRTQHRNLLSAGLLACLLGCGGGGGGGAPAPGDDTGGTAAFIAPLSGALQCPDAGGFGYDASRLPGNPCHYGVDIRTVNRTDKTVRACADGVVERAAYHTNPGYGNVIVIYHGLYLGLHTYTLYGHLASFASGIVADAPVSQGAPIGVAGNTGGVPEHLHFEFVRASNLVAWSPLEGAMGVPGCEGRVDPTIWVAGLTDLGCLPLGFTSGDGCGQECATTTQPPTPAVPGEFLATRFGGSNPWFIEWSEATGATSYVVVQYYYSDSWSPAESSPYWLNTLPLPVPPGARTQISPTLGSTVRRFEWSLAGVPSGTYYYKVEAANSAGVRVSRGFDGTIK